MTQLSQKRPVPLYLHLGAVLAVAATFVLLIIGQMVTSFRAGMADPIWPTEPWYLINNYKFDPGYLIEHSHRIAGFAIGGIVCLLVLGLWLTEPCRRSRWFAAAGFAVAIAGYGELHRMLMAQRGPEVAPTAVEFPVGPAAITLAGILLMLAVALGRLLWSAPGAGLRLLATTALLAVMTQGLLGGFRVKLNAIVGTDLAAVHGVFAQVVLSLLVLLAVLTERKPLAVPAGPEGRIRTMARWSLLLVIVVFVQIVWGAIVRHSPTPLAQRLHFLTAFLALAIGVLMLRIYVTCPTARNRAGLAGWALAALLATQLCLGVEAWMLKFGAGIPPDLVRVTQEDAAIRTLHALTGSAILATSLVLSVRLWRTIRPETRTSTTTENNGMEPAAAPERAVEMAGGKA